MQTILVPVDFSSTAYNAAKYAIQLAQQINANKIVLYNAYELPVIADGGLTVPIVGDIEDIKNNSTLGLNAMLQKLKTEFNNVDIETLNNYNSPIEGIKKLAKEINAYLIIMGITGGGTIEETLIGSNTISIAKETTIPVIIVPPNAVFKNVQNVFLAYSLLNIDESVPAENSILSFIQKTKSNLGILHVEKDTTKEYTDEYFTEKPINKQLISLSPKHHTIYHTDFIEGVNSFIDSHHVDLLIVIPKKHNFFERLFNKSHTTRLAFHSHVPLMVVHQ